MAAGHWTIRPRNRALRWSLFTLLGLAGAVVLLFGLIQTPPGKWVVARIASSAASGNGLNVRIEEIGGFLPWRITARRVVLSDPKGTFAEVRDLDLQWHPWQLVHGLYSIDRLEASDIEFSRRPELPPSPAKDQDSGPAQVPHILVDRIALPHVKLGQTVMGEAAEFSLQAIVDHSTDVTTVTIDAQRHDKPGLLKGTATYAPDSQQLDIDMTANEPAGGVLARLLNIDGAPAFRATVKGSGTLAKWDGTLNLQAGETLRVDGQATIRAAADAKSGSHRATLVLDGDLGRLVPDTVTPLFAGKTHLDAAALVGADARIGIEKFQLQSAGLDLALGGSFDAKAFTPDLTFALASKSGALTQPLLPEGLKLGALSAKGSIKGTPEAPQIAATIEARDVAAPPYRMALLTAVVTTTPAGQQALDIKLDGKAEDVSVDDAAAQAALGGHLQFAAAGRMSNPGGLTLTSFSLDGPVGQAQFAGQADGRIVAGKLQVARFDLAAIGPLAGRKLGGQMVMKADIDASADFGHFTTTLNGHLDNLSSGVAALDGLALPSLTLSGQISRATDGAIVANGVQVGSDVLQATLDGKLDQAVANLTAQVKVADLAKLDPRLSGAARADIALSGDLDHPGVKATISIPKGKAMGRDIEDLALAIDAQDVTGDIKGTLKLDGSVGGKPAKASAVLSGQGGARQLDDLVLSIGSVDAKGKLAQAADGTITGDIAIKAGNLNDLAPLTLTELQGALTATVKLDADQGGQRVAVDGTVNGLRGAGVAIGGARIKLSVLDAFGTPKISGNADITNLAAGSFVVDKATLTASQQGDATQLKLTANALGGTIDSSARLTSQNGAPRLDIAALSIAKDQARATLAAPAGVAFVDGGVRIDRMRFNTQGGSVTIQGSAGNTLNLDVALNNLPLALLALAQPDLQASGSLSGTIKLSGPAGAPAGQYDLTVSKASTPQLARGGIGPLDAKASGKLGNGRLTVEARINGPSLKGITVSGSVPLGAGELDLAIKGEAGLNLANTALATTAAYAGGNATLDATVKGTTDAPVINGTMRIVNGSFNDSINGMSFEKIDGTIVAEGRQIAIRGLSATTPNGGTVKIGGTVTLDPAAGLPGDINVELQKARLLSNDTVRLVADGKLTLNGPMASHPRLSGRIDVRSLDVNIPDQLPGSLQATQVRHINVPDADKAKLQTPQTKAQARRQAQKNKTKAAPMVIDLDLTLAAPARVFVRGRGIEAELGGVLKLGGTTDNPTTNGGFDLKHGRLDIGERRLNFSRGKIYFRGSADPELDLTAESQSADVTATVHVTGHASEPKIEFSSTPALPEDEILARLLFGKPAGSLTPGQAIQVARTIAQFSGGGGHQLDDVRRSLGISSLDIGTGENGGGQVGIGKRLNDNIYLGVSQGTTAGSGQVSVDIDITKNIKVQGKGGATGGEIGIGAQWDY